MRIIGCCAKNSTTNLKNLVSYYKKKGYETELEKADETQKKSVTDFNLAHSALGILAKAMADRIQEVKPKEGIVTEAYSEDEKSIVEYVVWRINKRECIEKYQIVGGDTLFFCDASIRMVHNVTAPTTKCSHKRINYNNRVTTNCYVEDCETTRAQAIFKNLKDLALEKFQFTDDEIGALMLENGVMDWKSIYAHFTHY